MHDETHLIGRSDAELATVDPLEMNLLVAKGIPALAHLDVSRYQAEADRWATDLKRKLASCEEKQYRRTPEHWDNDIHLFRLGVVCHFVHNELGIRYKEEQKNVKSISYTDPSDLFLNGVMDSRRGTCGSMTALHLALGRRLGWPVSLALARWHCILRFEKGLVVWNIEASNTEGGGFRANPDSYYQKEYGVAREDIDCGSDLTFLKPRQLLGYFIGLRGRHWHDLLDPNVPKSGAEYNRYSIAALRDFETALTLYPQSRVYTQMFYECSYLPPHSRHIISACR